MLYTLLVGLVAGWLTGKLMRGGGYGVVVDVVLGLLGGVVGTWLLGTPGRGLAGAILVSFVGAVVLVAITRVLKRV
ncbi:MAG: GlsB/YeaQ/YmgE family stress response membrane protein [Elusimicrobia bacterium]|nr:GlsB/YeaQ/YmgE family stress response membrane protein [Elusimicrobiota bacterium]